MKIKELERNEWDKCNICGRAFMNEDLVVYEILNKYYNFCFSCLENRFAWFEFVVHRILEYLEK